MRWALSAGGRAALARIASGRVLVGFDFDGTLAPIVADRARAAMGSSTKALLAALAELAPCVVISGRTRDDLSERLADVRLAAIVGHHGVDPDEDGAALEQAARPLRDWAAALPALDGVETEDKRWSVAIHFRAAADRGQARLAIDGWLAELPVPARVVSGKCVVEVLPIAAPHKGTALLRLIRRHDVSGAIFVGDDSTDEDAFVGGAGVVGIRVGASRASAATWCLRGQSEIDALLAWLVEVKSR